MTTPTHRLILLLVVASAALPAGCSARRSSGGDDDDSAPTADDDDDSAPADDDDATTPPPDDDDSTLPTLEGVWIGEASGTMVYGPTTYTCLPAGGTITVDAANFASGSVSFELEETEGTVLAANLVSVQINGATSQTTVSPITATFPVTLSTPSLYSISGTITGTALDQSNQTVTMNLTLSFLRPE